MQHNNSNVIKFSFFIDAEGKHLRNYHIQGIKFILIMKAGSFQMNDLVPRQHVFLTCDKTLNFNAKL